MVVLKTASPGSLYSDGARSEEGYWAGWIAGLTLARISRRVIYPGKNWGLALVLSGCRCEIPS